MRLALIGAGAVGLGVGSCALAAGQRVTFVTRSGSPQLDSLRRHGLVRTGVFGELRFAPGDFDVVDRIGALAGQPLDYLLVCTKTFDAEDTARSLAAAWSELSGPRRMVLFYNGWGSAQRFAVWLPPERIYSARVITGFRRPHPHTVEITVHADPIRIGSLLGADLGPLTGLCEAISKGGIPCEVSADIGVDLWSKMLYNCALNPLGALLGVPYGALAERAVTRAIMNQVVAEVFEVMSGCGFESHWGSAGEYLQALYDQLLPPTSRHESSMLQDLRAGRHTEVDALCGAIAELGSRAGVQTPVNSALCQLILALEAKPGAQGRSPLAL